MAGGVVVLTGATSGIGLAAATAMAGLGATVHLVGRDGERGREAKARVEAAGQAKAHLDLVDMGDADEVVAFGRRLLERYDGLAALVHNAGALSRHYDRNAAGVESTVATQVLGPYALTATVAPLLCQPTPGRIVTVSSGGMYTQRFDLGALEMQEDGYDGVVAYARVKRAQVVLADAWASRFAGAGVASYAMHPGWVDTPGAAVGHAGLPGIVEAAAEDPGRWRRHRRLAGGRRADGRPCGADRLCGDTSCSDRTGRRGRGREPVGPLPRPPPALRSPSSPPKAHRSR